MSTKPRRWRSRNDWQHNPSPAIAGRDDDENEQSRIPEDEGVHLVAVWVIELYTPSTVANLHRGMRRMGWERLRQHGRYPIDDVLATYRSGTRGGFVNLEFVRADDQPNLVPGSRRASLPHGVKAAQPSITSVTPSITAFAMQFILTDDAASALTDVLTSNYTTYRTPLAPISPLRFRLRNLLDPERTEYMAASIHSPRFQRRDRVAEVRRAVRDHCTAWVRARAPGVFAGATGGGLLPTAELVVTDVHPPFVAASHDVSGFREAGLDFDFAAWRSDEWPGRLLFGNYTARDNNDRRAWIFGGSRDELTAAHHAEPESNWSIALHAGEFVSGTLLRWSLTQLLAAFEERLGEIRDVAPERRVFGRTVAHLRQTRAMLLDTTLDAQLAAHEIREFCRDDSWYRRNAMEMTRGDDRGNDREVDDLLGRLREGQQTLADQLSERLRVVSDIISSATNLSASITGVRLQRLLFVVAVMTVVVAALSYRATG